MCSHHLIEPVACRPASGQEKGQVENQVGNLRDQLFTESMVAVKWCFVDASDGPRY